MSEFKGTKGKWVVDKHNNICVGYEEIAFLKSSTKNKERRANAKLIAHAPEMLDFINRISGEMLRNDFVLSEEWYEQAQKLIKSATEVDNEK